jgi:hypothetical protein
VGVSVEKKGNFRKNAPWQSAAQMGIAFFYCSSDSLKAQFTLSGNKALSPPALLGKMEDFLTPHATV